MMKNGVKGLQIFECKELFEEVQKKRIFPDSKTFVDYLPKRKLEEINEVYLKNRQQENFSLSSFIEENFVAEELEYKNLETNSNRTPEEHVDFLWDLLKRMNNKEQGSIIPLPNSYIVPGGRFGETFYWDSYFTMLGLLASKRLELVKDMVDNFSYMIQNIGYIPNGNRTYFLGRSQAPFFCLMLELLREATGEEDVFVKYLESMEMEYRFWMEGSTEINSENPVQRRVVMLDEGVILNRYWDANLSPRPEAFREDLELAYESKRKPEEIYGHIRAAAESGWDFSCRWFKDIHSFSSIHTTEIIPIDLNCLLYKLEVILSKTYADKGDNHKASKYDSLAQKRRKAILQYCWNGDKNFFFDYDFVSKEQKEVYTLGAAFPLFVEIAKPNQAALVKIILMKRFLQAGGLTTTLYHTGQQWDAPNGWAPLQWIASKGLMLYGFDKEAKLIQEKWISNCKRVYAETGKMMEKYDVFDPTQKAGGGEYPNQDGFGWTNGVYLAMTKK